MTVYAVGDIQGCYDCLRRLLDQVRFDPGVDRLWSVGDLVNRGPKSLETLRFLKSLGSALTAVLGNHDLHLLALLSDAHRDGKRDSLEAVLAAPDRDALCEWLRHLPLLHRERLAVGNGDADDFLLVHAGLLPTWDTAKAESLAAEVAQVLRGPDWRDFLVAMYGDQPDTWDDALDGNDRLRVITNVLTRLRFCDARGRLELRAKLGPETAPPGFRPWFDFPRPPDDPVILFGHWAALDGRTGKANIIGLDTGCVWGRRLTLMRLEDRRRFHVACG